MGKPQKSCMALNCMIVWEKWVVNLKNTYVNNKLNIVVVEKVCHLSSSDAENHYGIAHIVIIMLGYIVCIKFCAIL